MTRDTKKKTKNNGRKKQYNMERAREHLIKRRKKFILCMHVMPNLYVRNPFMASNFNDDDDHDDDDDDGQYIHSHTKKRE